MGNGIETVVTVRVHCRGRFIKITTTSRIPKALHTKRSWPRFGDARSYPSDDGDMLTVVSMDEIFFEKPRTAGTFPFPLLADFSGARGRCLIRPFSRFQFGQMDLAFRDPGHALTDVPLSDVPPQELHC
ncbi:hypothetical protein ACLOJK_012646 [Asimina triloba]